eukprot:contig_18328_g4493
MFKPCHCQALSKLSDFLSMNGAVQKMGSVFELASSREDYADDVDENDKLVTELLRENRMPYSFLMAVTSESSLFERIRRPVVDMLLSIKSVVEDYDVVRLGQNGSAAAYRSRYGLPSLSAAELRSRFKQDFPDAVDDPAVTG